MVFLGGKAYRTTYNVPYYADLGAGDSDLTWQLFGGIGYRFG